MSETEDRKAPHEIILVRRRSGGHGDGHHGGAWKIAFADFMTALMCFFLVMWLINATDKKTVTQIATYFNPLRLNDKLVSEKGLEDPDPSPPKEKGKEKGKPKSDSKPEAKAKKEKEKQKAKEKKSEAESKKGQAEKAAAQQERSAAAEMDLIRDPYGVLEQIVASEPDPIRPRAAAETDTSLMPKDIFDPAWSRPGSGQRDGGPRGGPGAAESAAGRADAPRSAAGEKGEAQAKSAATGSGTPRAAARDVSAESLAKEIGEAVAGLDAERTPGIEVADLGRELLISINDGFDYGMFAVGSSRPSREMISVMERVARVLAAKGGPVVIRGHTDARAYQSGGYDNWRLSSDRAQMAYHMMVRGGLHNGRVLRIEGHADRMLKLPADPLAPQNRRIEILVSKGRP